MQSKKQYILGVDPGLSGAFAVLDVHTNNLTSLCDMPTFKERGKSHLDCPSLAIKLGEVLDDVAFAVVEDVHSMPGQGVVSMFSFGVSKGIILGMLGMALVPVYLTPPAVWKGVYGLSSDKNKSRELASKKFPNWNKSFGLKKHDGRAESALLALFGKRFW